MSKKGYPIVNLGKRYKERLEELTEAYEKLTEEYEKLEASAALCPYSSNFFDYYPHAWFPTPEQGEKSLSDDVRYTAVNVSTDSLFSWVQGGVTSINVKIKTIDYEGRRYYCVQHAQGSGRYYAPAMFYGPFRASAQTIGAHTWPIDYWYWDDSQNAFDHRVGYTTPTTLSQSRDTGFALLPGGNLWLVVHVEPLA